jgi:cytochrome c oxidase cbb3-type subunit 3
VSPENDKLLEHEYDGIREYDNPLPGWWKGLFILSIAFAAVYLYWYHLGGPGKTIHQEFDADWKQYQAWKAAADKDAAIEVSEDLLAAWARDGAVLTAGHDIFVKNCVGCHKDDASGQIGPNLTDDAQIHGHTRMDLYSTIRDGVPDKGMVTWSQTMTPRQIATVAAYVSTLRGHPVAGGKEPQGEKVGPLE